MTDNQILGAAIGLGFVGFTVMVYARDFRDWLKRRPR